MSSGSERRDDELVALTEGAKLLGVHYTTLRRWADRRKVPYTRTPGGQRRFRVGDLRALIPPPSVPPEEEDRAAAGAA